MSARTVLVALTVILAAPAAADTGDDYSNNLFSDIAPLLALFGEQFAKQFMSQSMSWLDNIIFAMAPLGILTAIVAAIRVGGPPWLRAVVGRARENDAIVEMELKSSTSHEVCELWNGRGIVRTMGRPEVQQIIYLEDHQKDQKTFGLHTVESAMEAELLRAATYEDPLVSRFRNPIVKSSALRWKSLSVFTKLKLFWHLRKRDSEDLENNAILMFVTRQKSTLTNGDPHSETAEQESAPNISLNLHGGSKSEELYAAALCGIVLQFGMLVFCGFSVYHPAFSQRFPKNGRPVGANAFPIMALGTILLMVGMLICSAVVEQSTVETEYLRQQEGPNARLLWLQKSDTVSDQAFDSFVLGQSSSRRDRILTSRRQDNERTTTSTDHSDTTNHKANWVETIASNRTEAFTLLGVFFGLSGFILQFQGLRSMNWSASIAQLVCIFLMTIWRAWIRRGMIANPVYTKLREHHEMDWLALRIAKDSNFWPPDDLRHLSEHLAWEILTNDNNIACVGSWEPGSFSYLDAEKAQYALNIRQRLGQLTNWDGPASRLSIAVADSIEIVLNTLFDHTNHSAFTWSLKVRIGDIDGKIRFKVDKNIGINGMWEMDATHIEAALSLWLFHIHEKDESKKEESRNDWLRKDKSLKRKIRRLLGPGGSEALHRDIKWWIGDIDDKTKSNESNNVRQSSGFAGPVGFAGVEPSNTTQADVKVDNETSGPPLTVVSNVSLESSLAQHIFSSFMWAIVNDNSAEKDDNLAKQLNKDETSIVREDLFRIDNPETLLSLGLENKVHHSCTQYLQETSNGGCCRVHTAVHARTRDARTLGEGCAGIY
ncbi:hypothetical protein BDD12DRAFT_291003 [Trichophaea hybrida]|nr:hypothetical protein BDD12DRAFT_291003 [Trichophaea hybrida]